MSKHINVNPGQYKVAGRERMGEPLGQAKDKTRMNKSASAAAKKKTSTSKKPR